MYTCNNLQWKWLLIGKNLGLGVGTSVQAVNIVLSVQECICMALRFMNYNCNIINNMTMPKTNDWLFIRHQTNPIRKNNNHMSKVGNNMIN